MPMPPAPVPPVPPVPADSTRRIPGHVDRIETGADGLRVSGWTLAARVSLFCGTRAARAAPSLHRRDIADRLGVDPGAAGVGYVLHLPDPGPGPAVLLFEPSGGGRPEAMILPGTGTGTDTGAPASARPPRWMPRRLAGLFTRYAAQHLDQAAPGPAIRDDTGAMAGNIDRLHLTGTRLTVEGWADARRLTLVAGDRRASTEPTLPRPDVAAATGHTGELGFFLALPRPAAGAHPLLIAEPAAGAPIALPLPLSGSGRARRALLAGFARRLAGALPAVLLWRLTRRPRWRAAVKRRLGLTGIDPVERLDPAVLAPPAAAARDAAIPAAIPEAAAAPGGVTIVLPVYNAFDLLPEVLARVAAHTDLPWRLIVIEDCSPDDRVRPFLEGWAAEQALAAPGRVTLLRNTQNLGFIGSVNRGLAAARAHGDPVILLNSDALVPAGWASRLVAPMRTDPTVASVTPMSNDAEIFSAPAMCRRAMLAPGQADRIDAAAQALNPAAARAEAPTGVGFCMALNPEFLARVPTLDTAFGRGYGEEVDWCQRTRRLGGRHLGIASLFVEHRGGESFGSAEKQRLVALNNARIARRYPAYDAEVQAFIAADPLATARLALAIAWAGAWAAGAPGRRVPVYLAHSMGGGAESYLGARIASDLADHGRPAVIVRVGGARRWRLELLSPAGICAGETDDFALVARLLAPLEAREIVYSCGVGDPDPAELPARLLALAGDGDGGGNGDGSGDGHGGDCPVEILFHDYFPLSPAYTLLDGDGRYRGPLTDPETRAGDRAHQSLGADGQWLDLAGWQAQWGRLLDRATVLTVFSADSRDQIAAAYPGLGPRIRLRPHALPVIPPRVTRAVAGQRTIAVLGNIGYQKGAAALRDLARHLDGPGAPRLVLVGNIDPAYALPAHVQVHGSYRVADLAALVAHYGITDWLIPSIWPETFSYTTHEALATGLPVWAFALGAQGAAVTLAANGRPVPFDAATDPGQALADALAVGAGDRAAGSPAG